MRKRALWAAIAATLISGPTSITHSQEMGPLETYGSDGRFFSSGSIDYYLLSRQSYATEDSSGYQGQVRAVKKYEAGAYEVLTKDYIAQCFAPFDKLVQVTWSTPGQENTEHSVEIVNPAKFPGETKKESYNLYWAACHGQLRKFK
jgi:hypothetical protein